MPGSVVLISISQLSDCIVVSTIICADPLHLLFTTRNFAYAHMPSIKCTSAVESWRKKKKKKKLGDEGIINSIQCATAKGKFTQKNSWRITQSHFFLALYVGNVHRLIAIATDNDSTPKTLKHFPLKEQNIQAVMVLFF